jgi:hypothetical protein
MHNNLSQKRLFFCVQCDKNETDRKEGNFGFILTLQLMLITITFWYAKCLISMRISIIHTTGCLETASLT